MLDFKKNALRKAWKRELYKIYLVF